MSEQQAKYTINKRDNKNDDNTRIGNQDILANDGISKMIPEHTEYTTGNHNEQVHRQQYEPYGKAHPYKTSNDIANLDKLDDPFDEILRYLDDRVENYRGNYGPISYYKSIVVDELLVIRARVLNLQERVKNGEVFDDYIYKGSQKQS